MPRAGAVPSSLIRAGGYGSAAAGVGRLGLGSGFGGIRGAARGNLKSAAGAVPVRDAGAGVGRGAADAVAPAEREEAVRELRKRREMIDSQTKRLEEVLAKIRAGDAKENNLAKNSPKPSTPPAKPQQQQQNRVTGVGESPPASLAAFSPISRFAFDSPAVGGISNSNPAENLDPAASRKPKSPPGGRKLAAPSETDPAEESAVVRAVLSKISAPRVTSTAKKERPAGTSFAAAVNPNPNPKPGSFGAAAAPAVTGVEPAAPAPLFGAAPAPATGSTAAPAFGAAPAAGVGAGGAAAGAFSFGAAPAIAPSEKREEPEKEKPEPEAPKTGGFNAAFLAKANAGYNAAQKALQEDLDKAAGKAPADEPAAPKAGAAGGVQLRRGSRGVVGGGIFRLWRGGERSVVFVWSARVVVGVLGGGE